MSEAVVIAIVGVVVSIVGGLLALIMRSNEKRICDLERERDETTRRLHATELEVAKLQGLNELRGQIERIQETLDRLVREVATMTGQLRPLSRGSAPSSPPKHG